MATATSTAEPIGSFRHPARVWAAHLLAFALPVACLAFLLTGPWYGWQAVEWLSLSGVSVRASGAGGQVAARGGPPAGGDAPGLAVRLRALRPRCIPLHDPRSPRGARRGPRLLDARHVRGPRPDRRELGLLGHRRRARAPP